MKCLDLITPGEILREEFINPYGLTPAKLAIEIRVPANRIYGIINHGREITPETAIKLAMYFQNSPRFWLNLQMKYNLDKAILNKDKFTFGIHPIQTITQ